MRLNRESLAYRTRQILQCYDTPPNAVIGIDLPVLEAHIAAVKNAFGPHFFHAVAVKANPLSAILGHMGALGMGAEAASLAEVLLARSAGIPVENIVFDSPVKTDRELSYLHQHFNGIHLNANSLRELRKLDQREWSGAIGLRLNFLQSGSDVAYLNVSGRGSKFGEAVLPESDLAQTLAHIGALSALHVHSGSQFSAMAQPVEAIANCLEMAEKIEALCGYQKIKTIDIGGGFPVRYTDAVPYDITEYASALRERCPGLFSGKYRVVTELGRYYHAYSGFSLTRIEDVKHFGDRQVVIQHLGADMFLREAYNPGDWPHRMWVLTPSGQIKTDTACTTDVAGPLCFGGDYVAREQQLATTEPGDLLLIADVGANTFSLWSRHCSRPFPAVYTLRGDTPPVCIRPEERMEELMGFWGDTSPIIDRTGL